MALRGLTRMKEVAQVSQTAVLALDDAVEGIEHHAVGSLVERQLHAYGVLTALQLEHLVLVECHHHAVAVNVSHRGWAEQ